MTVFYIIKSISAVSSALIDRSVCTFETARKSRDGLKLLLKFEANASDSIFTGETLYTKDELSLPEGEW